MINLEICPFEKQYINEILCIENLSFTDPWSRESMEKELLNSLARYLVVKCNSQVIGYGGMWLILDEGHITNIAIHPEFRGIGAGNLLLQALISLCTAEGITALTLEVRASNTVAQNLYYKYGFLLEGIRKGYYADNNEDALILWKRNIK
jgi:ribosomal-protein-alanine N-acetyltransferase